MGESGRESLRERERESGNSRLDERAGVGVDLHVQLGQALRRQHERHEQQDAPAQRHPVAVLQHTAGPLVTCHSTLRRMLE